MNWVDPVYAFTEGLGFIASPSILPLLPLILATSLDGGPARPYGVFTGFVLAFGFFAWGSPFVTHAVGIELHGVRTLALLLLAGFALALLVPRVRASFNRATAGLAPWGKRFGSGRYRGFATGLMLGLPIGLVWTPSARDMLAQLLVQISTQETRLHSLLALLGFAAGAGVPLLVIALLGRRALVRYPFLVLHSRPVGLSLGVLLLVAVSFLATGMDAEKMLSDDPGASMKEVQGLVNAVPPYPAPPLSAIDRWFGSRPLNLKALKGKVVLLDFWSYSCINCVRSLPQRIALDQKYRNDGLVVIGLLSPIFSFEKRTDNVKKALGMYGVTYPVALDGNLRNWVNYENRFWPSQYLIDRQGQVVYTHFGEGDDDILETNILTLLGMEGPKILKADGGEGFDPTQTPETYLGYARSERYGNKTHRTRDADGDYRYPSFLPIDYYALDGKWRVGPEAITSRSPGASLRLNFKASKVFLVLGSAPGHPVHATLTLNGAPLIPTMQGNDAAEGAVTVTGHRLYELIDQKESKNRLLEIVAQEPGLEAYAFTFGN